jgi:diphthamide synthase (EF-2-diphthine--ammonia ligase)
MREAGDWNVVGLLTTFNESANRVAMHAVRRELVEAQADAASLPLWPVELPWPCCNEVYEGRMRQAIDRARNQGIVGIAFGDLYLEDVRAYRIKLLAGTGLEPIFPIWGTPADTPPLARKMLAAGLKAVLTCVDPKQLDAKFVGRSLDAELLCELPASVDPCGERGEFHTFCHAGPMFKRPVPVRVGETLERDGFWFADVQMHSAANG